MCSTIISFLSLWVSAHSFILGNPSSASQSYSSSVPFQPSSEFLASSGISPSFINSIPGSIIEPPNSLSTMTSGSSGTSSIHKAGILSAGTLEQLSTLVSWYIYPHLVHFWLPLYPLTQGRSPHRYSKHLCHVSSHFCFLQFNRSLSPNKLGYKKAWCRFDSSFDDWSGSKLYVSFSRRIIR